MRCFARIGLALCGLALAAPECVWADPPASSAPAVGDTKPHKHKRGLFGKRHLCPECQRAEVLARDGVNVPPPPPVPPMLVTQGGAQCQVCQEGAAVADGSTAAMDPNGAPGFAVVGESAPGAEPSPIGVVSTPGFATSGPAMAMAGRGAPRDNMLMATSMAPSPVRPPGHNRPHVISHLFGLDAFGHHARERREHRREVHASIPYGPQAQPEVTDLPKSVVYGRRGQ